MAKNKTLPKDFEALLKEGNLEKLKAVFDKCSIDARGGYSKQTALAFSECPDQLAAWLVANGLSLSLADSYGETPLQARSGHWNGKIRGLLAATTEALEHLYRLFDVTPVPRRNMHDGVSPIIARAKRWQDQHQELWELLVSGSGAAQTVQGEVIRISGRIAHEVEGNGGTNWDAQFKQMADAWLTHIKSGNQLSAAEIDEAAELIKEIKGRGGDMERLCELSTVWVALNPLPKVLPKPEYQR